MNNDTSTFNNFEGGCVVDITPDNDQQNTPNNNSKDDVNLITNSHLNENTQIIHKDNSTTDTVDSNKETPFQL